MPVGERCRKAVCGRTVRRLTRRQIAPSGGRGSEGGDLGATRLTRTGNREGTTAWRESTGRSEGVEGVAVQGPRDKVKAILLEAKFPSGATVTPCDTTPEVAATGIGRSGFVVSTLPAGGRRAASLLKGTDRPPTSRSIRLAQRGIRDGLRGASPIGHGVRIVVVGVTTGRGVRESRTQGEVAQVSKVC
jgi:hypothetical protein